MWLPTEAMKMIDPCVEDDDVDPAETCPQFIGHRVRAGDLTRICLQDNDLRGQVGTGSGKGGGIVAGHQHRMAALVKLLRSRQADTGGAAGHQGDGVRRRCPLCIHDYRNRSLDSLCQGFVVCTTEMATTEGCTEWTRRWR